MSSYHTINSYISGSYSLAKNTNLIITGSGGIGGGLFASYQAVVFNNGRINNDAAFYEGGTLYNGSASYTGALIEGQKAVFDRGGALSIVNYGTIKGIVSGYDAPNGEGVYLEKGGSITNGSASDHGALIEGSIGIDEYHAYGVTVANYGTILGKATGRYFPVYGGIEIYGGIVVNGGVGDSAAHITAGEGVVLFGSGSLANFGTISGSVTEGAVLNAGGNLVNGAVTDTSALISGIARGVGLTDTGTLTNFGAIIGLGPSHGDNGVQLNAGGRVINGAAASPAAVISGYTGALLSGAGTVANYGSIRGYGAAASEFGVYLTAGGTVINGAGTDRKATIEGAAGVAIAGGAGTVTNSGTILADDNNANAFGVMLAASGTVTNGSRNNHNALIQGSSGLYLDGGTATNFGTITAVGDTGVGVHLAGAAITNGAAGHTAALIDGYTGVGSPTGDAATVTNFGTIEGADAAVYFRASSDVLNVEAGCAFDGAVYGGGGTLDLASGTGTISSLFASTGVVVSGSIAKTTFQGFGTVKIAQGATFADADAVSLAAGQTVNAAGVLTLGGTGKSSIVNAGLIEANGVGVLTLAGTVTNTGTIEANTGSVVVGAPVSGSGVLAVNGGTMVVAGAVTGSGKETINGGRLEFSSTFTQTVSFTGTLGDLELAQSQTYTGTISGFSKTGSTSLDLLDVSFVSASEATFSGTAAAGVLTVTDGTHTAKINLKGNYTTSTFVCSSDGHGGVLIVDPTNGKTGAASPLAFIADMARLRATPGLPVHAEPARSAHDLVLTRPQAVLS